MLGLGTARHTILTTRLTPLNTAFGLGWAPAIAQSSTGTAIDPRLPGVNYTTGAEDQLCVPQTLGWKHGRAMLLAYQSGGQTTNGTLPADPHKRWRCLFVDEVDHIAVDRTAQWESASNYNHSRPFSAIDDVTVAVPAGPPDGS